MLKVQVGSRKVGDGEPCYVIAEIGINHNGDVEIAKKLVALAAVSGCDAVKFQKRTIDVVYTRDELAKQREHPWGTTNGDLKRRLEFGQAQFEEIDAYCKSLKIPWFASCWDEASVDFIDRFDPPCYKISSASLTDDALLRHTRAKGKPILMSTGMSNLEQVQHAVEVIGKKDLVLLHTCSTYPSAYDEINLRAMPALRDRFGVPVGYSGHESGLAPSVGAVAMGACCLERHITLDRAMFGSDQAASLGPSGLTRLVRDVRLLESSLGDGVKRVTASEVPIMKKLRRVGL
jgi:N-acetylneuraminate synthase